MSRHAIRAQVGIRDVARVAGVSMASVSRVLNDGKGTGSVRPDIVERVRKAAGELQYRPNPWARSLRTARASTIGVIVSDLSLPFAVEVLHVLYARCREQGSHLLFHIAEDDDVDGLTLAGLPSSDRVDGAVVIGGRFLQGSDEAFSEALARLVREYRHVVTVASRPSVAGETAIIVDDVAGVTLAMEHLISLGHTRIAHIRNDQGTGCWEDRQRALAFASTLESHGLAHDSALEVAVDHRDLGAAQAALRHLLGVGRPPTAVFTDCDAAAITVLKTALLAGIRVPEDLSVVGFDDIEFAALSTPGLTTVRQPVETMAELAAAALLDRVTGESLDSIFCAPGKTVIVPPTFVVRESCGPPG